MSPYLHSSLSNIQSLNLIASAMTWCRPSTLYLTGGKPPHDVFAVFSERLSSSVPLEFNDRILGELIPISKSYKSLNTTPTASQGSQDPKVYSTSASTSSIQHVDTIFESILSWYPSNSDFQSINITFVVFDSHHNSPAFSNSISIRDEGPCSNVQKLKELWAELDEERELEHSYSSLASESFTKVGNCLKTLSLAVCTLIGAARIGIVIFSRVFTHEKQGRMLHKLHSQQ